VELNNAQQAAVTHIYDYGETYLIGPMGSGKTGVGLHAVDELLRDKHIKRGLVVAPLRVCNEVWQIEPARWGLSRLNVVCATGSVSQRARALTGSANVVCINFEKLAWLFTETALWQTFDMLIIDEGTKIKSGSVGFKALRKHLHQFKVRLLMTGTPVSEDFTGLFYQVMAVDDGRAFGKNKQNWLDRYFYSTDYKQYNWEVSPHQVPALIKAFKQLVVVLPEYTDELPPLNEIPVIVPDCRTPEYDELVGSMQTGNVTAANAAVLVGKLQQAASGFLYDDDGKTQQLHDAKHVHQVNTDQTPLIVVYQFQEELRRLQQWFPRAYTVDQLDNWRLSRDGVLLMHPRSAGHGLDLTHAHTMIFMSPVWSRDLTRQTIARIWRRGQTSPCSVYTLCGDDTIDMEIVDREHYKAGYHEVLLQHL